MNQPVLFEDMHDKILKRGCSQCKLRGHPVVRGSGDLNSEILILGEQPGKAEIEELIPIIGSAGQLLVQRLQNVMRRKRQSVRIENTVRCMAQNVKKKHDESTRWVCSMYYENIINKMPNLKVIITAGSLALNTLLHQYGKGQYNIVDARSHTWVWQDRVHVVPTYSLPYLLPPDNRHLIGDFSKDLARAKSLVRASLPETGDVLYITKRSLAESMLKRILAREKAVAIDLETFERTILTLAISIDNGENAIVLGPDLINELSIKRLLLKIVKKIPIIGQNFNGFDREFLQELLGECPICKFDTMYGSYVEDEKRGVHDLNMIAARYGYYGGYDWRLMLYLKRHALTKANMNKVPIKMLGQYNGRDVIANHRAFKTMSTKFSVDYLRLTKFLTKVSEVTDDFERNGIGFDMTLSRELEATYKQEAEKHARLARLAVNRPKLMLTSDHQVRALLYDELALHKAAKWDRKKPHLVKGFKTDSGKWSVDENTLIHLESATGHKFMKHLLDFRSNQNAIDDHVISMRKLVNDDDRIHVTTFLHGTRTGRVAMRLHSLKHDFKCRCSTKCKKCKNPQDIMWNLFKARDGHQFIKADYSQLEMRIMAEISGDKELIELYERGEDFHNETQQIVYADLYTSKSDDSQRKVAKNVNFGTAYGFDEDGLYAFLKGKIRNFSLTPKQVAEFHRGFYSRFHTLREWQLAIIKFMQKHGYVVTWTGRTRALDVKQGKHAENQAVNTVIQSSAHDILLVSLLEYYHHRKRRGMLIMEHHDAIISEVLNQYVCAEVELLEKIMVNPPTMQYFGPERKLNIPLKVDVKIGPTLGNMGEIPF